MINNSETAISIIQQNKDSYNRIANEWNATREKMWNEVYDFQKYINTEKPIKILDIGCGTGRLLNLFADMNKKNIAYCGFDISEKLLSRAAQKAGSIGIKAEFACGDMTSLPYTEKEFDYIFCIAALHHIPTKEMRIKALSEMRRVLKINGKMFMTNWNMWRLLNPVQKSVWQYLLTPRLKQSWKWADAELKGIKDIITYFGNGKAPIYYHAFTIKELKKLAQKTGFTVSKAFYAKNKKQARWWNGSNIVFVCS